MSSVKMRIVTVFFVLLLLQHAVDCNGAVHNRFLVIAKNLTDGVEIRIYHNITSHRDWPSYEKTEMTGYFLSQECGTWFHKCNQLAVISVNSSAAVARSYVAIVPLANALGLLKLKVDSTGFLYISGKPHIIDLSEPNYNCSPTSIYHIQNSYYIVCPNSDSNYIKHLELQLNTTHLSEYWLASDYPYIGSVRNLTNSIYVDLPAQSGQVIFFATGYQVFYFQPLDGTVAELDIDLQGNKCFATSIEYIGEWEMLVYCDNNRAVYVNINSESIFYDVEYDKDGWPYVCPNPDVYLAVYIEQHYIQYSFRSTRESKNFQLPGKKFDNGICGGSQKVTLFAFTDRERGTQLLNASAGSIRSLSETTCINYSCQPLVMLQDRYLVIREKRGVSWYISVLDSLNNFLLVLEAKYTKADLMAVIETLGINANNSKFEGQITLGNGAAEPAQSNEKTKENVDIVIVVICLSAFCVLVIAGIVFSSLFLVFHRRRRQNSFELIVSCQEDGETPQGQPSNQSHCGFTNVSQESCCDELRPDD